MTLSKVLLHTELLGLFNFPFLLMYSSFSFLPTESKMKLTPLLDVNHQPQNLVY